MRYVNFFIVFLLALGWVKGYTQSRNDYYIFPIKPGERNSLSGTMGELRSNHFHAGLDIRTDGRTGLPVHAAAEGYVSRISVSRGGYGNALYIQHPNGNTTVYAHLQEFKGDVADYVRQMQYEKQSFELTLYFKAGEFPVKQGNVVALSGNSGSSGGPHVHFDLRDKNHDLLNPLDFGFDEILDNTPPVVQKVALKSLNINSRIEGDFGRFEYSVKRVGNDYVIENPIEVFGEIGIELYAYDRLDNTRFKCGINKLTASIDGEITYKHDISTFAFSEQRNILRHMDYQQVRTTGERFHKLYIDDGDYLRFYTTNRQKGKIHVKPEKTIPVEIEMSDSYGNTSKLSFTLKGKTPDKFDFGPESVNILDWKVEDNTLKITAPYSGESNLTINNTVVTPTFHRGNGATYLWDLRKELATNVKVGELASDLKIDRLITPAGNEHYENDQFRIDFTKNDLFDTLYLTSSYLMDVQQNQEYFTIGDEMIPLRNNIKVTLKPRAVYEDKSSYAVYALDSRNNPDYKGGTWKGNNIVFNTREMGRFTILADTTPPTVSVSKLTSDYISFRIDDDLSGIDKFNCYINGKWVLMNYDYKRKLIWSEKLDVNDKFIGELKLVVTDNVNNIKEYTTKIN